MHDRAPVYRRLALQCSLAVQPLDQAVNATTLSAHRFVYISCFSSSLLASLPAQLFSWWFLFGSLAALHSVCRQTNTAVGRDS